MSLMTRKGQDSMMSDDKGSLPTLRFKTGLLCHNNGCVEQARFYYDSSEEDPPNRTRLDPANYTTWIADDGTVGIRRGTSISIGASAAYSANYDTLDWGN